MKRVYKFIAGNSRVTPIGIAAAVIVALVLQRGAVWTPAVYIAVLLATLAVSTLEPVQ